MIVVRILRSVLGIPLIVLGVIVAATVIGIAGDGPFADRVLRAWCRFVLFCAGARVVSQAPRLDPGKSYVFVSNHTSNLDVPAIVPNAPSSVRFVAKSQLRKIPLFGWGAERMGHVFIDRRDAHGAAKAITGRLQKGLGGVGLFFFAEGTRSTTDEMLPFKKGAAIAALTSGLDCVPIGVAGARHVLPPKGFPLFRPGTIAVVFGEPIPIAGHTLDERNRLVAEQRSAVEQCVEKARELLKAASGRS
jgi:1-acyl-sn-glycerol-3-phosphate acyltransferase